ncbi:ABC transporter ATP-binding protein [Methanohalobium sp.]|uniref:ABC transporter ATP-binding protein n=1 Tax=Methanohalobium sp. TaxID=2837493 RepID=UPI0025F3C545|nr:ABC transporter ATP-binding protein [Methanohalobium sp.]
MFADNVGSMDDVISVKNLSKSIGNHQVLKNICFSVKKGSTVAIYGPNGAGKTTLFKILSTLWTPTEGSVAINKFDVSTDSSNIRKSIGILSHETFLYNDLTAEENLCFYGQMYGIDNDILDKRIEYFLEKTGITYRATDRVSELSRGMKQRLSIARTLIHEPQVLFLDEPYTGLDQNAVNVFENILKELDSKKTTKLIVSHNIEQSFKLCDRAIILDKGKIVFDDLKKDISDVGSFKQTYKNLINS